jgi:hypothetical protein
MEALQHLTQLQHLQLQTFALHRSSNQLLQPEVASYSALAASTELTSLTLHNVYGMPVPKAAFDYMFHPGRMLPHLKVLTLGGDAGHPCVGAAQVAMIAASCPALQEVMLRYVTPKGFDVNQSINVTPVAMKLKKLMPAIY